MTLWESRDFPVLDYLAERGPQVGFWTQSRSEQPSPDIAGLTDADVHRAIETLLDAGYVSSPFQQLDGSGQCFFQDLAVTGQGKQVLGLWPLFDVLGSPAALAGTLDTLALEAATEEERTALRKAASVVGHLAPEMVKATLVGVLREWAKTHGV